MKKLNLDTKITDMPVLGKTLINIALSLHKKDNKTISTQTEQLTHDHGHNSHHSLENFKFKRFTPRKRSSPEK